jgi:hypothetical protein
VRKIGPVCNKVITPDRVGVPSFIFLYHPGLASISFPFEQALKSVSPRP